MAFDLQPPSKKIITEFPQDILLFHILPRLPGRSVLRFKCVSKLWNSFLSTPLFIKMHLLCIPNDDHQNPHKLLIFSVTRPCMFRTMDCEAPEYGLTTSRNLPFKLNNNEKMSILTSFHGLVCVGINSCSSSKYSNLILWNPLTGDHKVLSRTNSAKTCYMIRENIFKLFYDSPDDDYKLICVNCSQLNLQIYLYSLKSDSWRKLNSTYDFNKRGASGRWWPSSWLNGNFYFLREVGIGEDIHNTDPPLYSVIKFNTKTEKFTEIPTLFFRGHETTYLGSTVLKGYIHIYVICDDYPRRPIMERESKVELWRMGEDEKWTNVATYFLKEPCIVSHPELIHVMRNGNWLMDGEGDIYKVDLEKHTKDNLSSSSDGKYRKRGKYIETFVSPNQYIKQ